MKTTDLIDEYEDIFTIVNISTFQRFGSKTEFHGEIVTVKCFEDNTKAKVLLETDGQGKVLVVDGAGSHGRALMGGNVAAIAVDNGWEGVVINGCVRDSHEINPLPIAVVALAATPRRPLKQDTGETGVAVSFAGVTFEPGKFVYVDEDGMLLSDHLKEV